MSGVRPHIVVVTKHAPTGKTLRGAAPQKPGTGQQKEKKVKVGH